MSKTGRIEFLDGLALLLIGLKLSGVINWSWWWVLAPFWVPALLAFLLLIYVLVSKQ